VSAVCIECLVFKITEPSPLQDSFGVRQKGDLLGSPPSLLRGTAQRHRNGPAWASNDALSKALARTRVPQHLAPRTPDYWAPTHPSSP
jgi:hypothetical protein